MRTCHWCPKHGHFSQSRSKLWLLLKTTKTKRQCQKQSYNFCLSVHSFSVQQVALGASLAASLTLGRVCLTCSHKMLDRSLNTPLQHKTRQHRCPSLPTDCHSWLEPPVPYCLMGKSLLPTALGAYCQDNAVIPRASGMHAAGRAQCSQYLPVSPVPQLPYGSQHLAARRAPPSMKLAVGTAGRETPAPSPLIGCRWAVI